MRHSVKAFSFIPWDAGKPIPVTAIAELEALILGLGFRKHTVFVRHEQVFLYRYSLDDAQLYLRIFVDGTGQFIIAGNSKQYRSPKDIDPDALNERKWLLHKEIMSANPKWQILRSVISKIRGFVRSIHDNVAIRPSATEDWEAAGLSYVFTSFLVKAKQREISDDMLSVLLAPKRRGVSESSAKFEDTASSSVRVTNPNIKQLCLADLPGFCAWYSWASSVCVYVKSNQPVQRYLTMLSGTHRAWFRFYLLSRHLDRLSPKITQQMTASEVDRLNYEVSDIHREAFSLRNLNRSMVSDLDISAGNVVWEQSRLSSLYEDICEKSNLLRIELEHAIDRRSNSRLRYLEIVLLTLTFIQAISAYVAIRESDALSTLESVAFLGLGLFALFLIFWRR